jgi:site-specific DNA-methyltransferase (adenine-specific)
MTQNRWDSIIPLDRLWVEYKRMIKSSGAIVLTASQPFTSKLVSSNYEMFKYAWVWRKPNATGHLNAKRMPMKEHEDVLVFVNGASRYNPQGLITYGKTTKRGNNGTNFGKSGNENFQEFTNYPRSVIETTSEGKFVHPTQKPVALFEYLIKTYTNECDLVLDNTAGVLTTAVACENTNRRFIVIEKEEEYINKGIARLNGEYRLYK